MPLCCCGYFPHFAISELLGIYTSRREYHWRHICLSCVNILLWTTKYLNWGGRVVKSNCFRKWASDWLKKSCSLHLDWAVKVVSSDLETERYHITVKDFNEIWPQQNLFLSFHLVAVVIQGVGTWSSWISFMKGDNGYIDTEWGIWMELDK